MKQSVLGVFMFAAGATALAGYPEKPITLVVPFAAGGPTDRIARDFAEALRRTAGGQPVVVENAGGAGGNVGAAKVARAKPDGYTLLFHNIAMATAPTLYRTLPYKPLEDFEYLGMISDVPMTVIGRTDLAAENVAELKQLVATNPQKFTIANAGVGSAAHLCGLLFQQAIGTSLVTVPYKGTGPAMSDLLGGQIDLMCDQTSNTSAQIASGRVKVYGITSKSRINTPSLASVPTLDEKGLKDFSVAVWHGLYAPKGTPTPIVEKLNEFLKASLQDADFQRRQTELGAEIVKDGRTSRETHKRFVVREMQRWQPVLKAAAQYAD